MLNSDSRRRSAVGRMRCEDGEARLRPFNRPPTMRIRVSFQPLSVSLVRRLQVALAMIAPLRAPRRTVPVGFGFVARTRFLAAGALHEHAAAFTISNQTALAGRLERLFATGGVGVVFRFCASLALHRPVEISAGERCDFLAELVAQHAGLDLLDLAFGEFGQLERTVGHPDQPVHFETEVRQHVAHFTIFAFADRKYQPDVGALVSLQRRIDRAVFHAIDFDAPLQFVELRRRHLAMSAHTISPKPTRLRKFERASQAAIVGEQQQAFSVKIQPPDADQPRQSFRQVIEHRRPAFRVSMGGHQPTRLMVQEQPRALARRQRLAVDGDDVILGDVERGRIDKAAVDRDAALHDPFLRVTARGKPCPRDHLGDALAGFLFTWRSGRTAFLARSLAIGAAAAERRTFGENLAVVLVFAARPVRISIERSGFAAGMFLPVGTARPTLAVPIAPRPFELRPLSIRALAFWTMGLGAILAGARKARTFVAAAVFTRLVVTRLVVTALFKTFRTIARGTRVASSMIGRTRVALMPRF